MVNRIVWTVVGDAHGNSIGVDGRAGLMWRNGKVDKGKELRQSARAVNEVSEKVQVTVNSYVGYRWALGKLAISLASGGEYSTRYRYKTESVFRLAQWLHIRRLCEDPCRELNHIQAGEATESLRRRGKFKAWRYSFYKSWCRIICLTTYWWYWLLVPIILWWKLRSEGNRF